jgi:hypothetical protein
MKIVFINGNGFDINLKLKTRYTDFYKYYKDVVSKNESIIELKKSISNDIENWADLELELGKHSVKVKSKEEFIEIFEDIGDNLADYLKEEENKFDISKIDKQKLFDYISFPENSLPKAQKNEIDKIRTKWAGHHWYINVITFNYTKTFEKIIKKKGAHLEIGTHHKAKILYQGIEHIHGYIDNRMVMGVNDITQIKNKELHSVQDVLDAFVKNNCNKAMQHTVDELCNQQLNAANLICIFGSSLGETDKIWWEIIGTRLLHECHLIIFDRQDTIPERRAYKKGAIITRIKNSFLNKTTLTKEEKGKVFDKIFVGINTDMFNGIQNKT